MYNIRETNLSSQVGSRTTKGSCHTGGTDGSISNRAHLHCHGTCFDPPCRTGPRPSGPVPVGGPPASSGHRAGGATPRRVAEAAVGTRGSRVTGEGGVVTGLGGARCSGVRETGKAAVIGESSRSVVLEPRIRVFTSSSSSSTSTP